jgi:PST family polysaccharide transporter
MGMDLYPRLSAAANDNKEMNRLVNEQTEMGLLLAGPAVLATSALAPYIIMILYSSAYLDAVDVVRWQILGSTLKVVAWPIGTIQLAKARKGAFIATEIGNGVATIILLYLGIKMFGLVGAGIAAFVSYSLLVLISWAVGYSLSGFKWSRSSALTLLAMGLSAAVVFLCVTLIEGLVGTLIATGVSLLVGIGSLMRLRSVMQLDVLAMIKAKLKR